MTARAVGLDIGGTNVRLAIVEDGAVVTQQRAATPVGDPTALVDTIIELVRAHGDGLPVGVGIAGGIDRRGTLLYATNLRMSQVPLGPRLEEALGRSVALVNDATAAAWAEHRLGAARGCDDVVMVTLGTGLGGGLVVGGNLVVGATGNGGELGHMIVVEGGEPCGCGNRGCLEAYASGSALGRDGRSGHDVVAGARAGDPADLAHVSDVGRWVGVGLTSVIAALDPERVVLGGGAGQGAFDLLVDPIRDAVAARIYARGHRALPPIVPAHFGDDAGVIGAALLATDRVAVP